MSLHRGQSKYTCRASALQFVEQSMVRHHDATDRCPLLCKLTHSKETAQQQQTSNNMMW